MAVLMRGATPILTVIALTVLVIALGLIGGGVALVWMGGIGDTEITLLGNSFKSANVGVAGVFCGTVLGILSLRKLIGAVERIGVGEGQTGKEKR